MKWTVVIGLMIIGRAAFADKPAAPSPSVAPAPAANPPASDPATERARELFMKAQRDYDLGLFTAALQGFSEAYKVKSFPKLLFNIGQCHRMNGDNERATVAFRAYLREESDAPNRAEIEALIVQLEADLLRPARHAAEPRTTYAALGGIALVLGAGAIAAGGWLISIDHTPTADPPKDHARLIYDTLPGGLAAVAAGAVGLAGGLTAVLYSAGVIGKRKRGAPAMGGVWLIPGGGGVTVTSCF